MQFAVGETVLAFLTKSPLGYKVIYPLNEVPPLVDFGEGFKPPTTQEKTPLRRLLMVLADSIERVKGNGWLPAYGMLHRVNPIYCRPKDGDTDMCAAYYRELRTSLGETDELDTFLAKKFTPRLRQLANNAKSDQARLMLLETAALYQDPCVIMPLMTASTDLDRSLSFYLSIYRVRTALRPLLALVTSNITPVRKSVCEALGVIRDRKAIPSLLTLVADDDAVVCKAANEALCAITGEHVHPNPGVGDNGKTIPGFWNQWAVNHKDELDTLYREAAELPVPES